MEGSPNLSDISEKGSPPSTDSFEDPKVETNPKVEATDDESTTTSSERHSLNEITNSSMYSLSLGASSPDSSRAVSIRDLRKNASSAHPWTLQELAVSGPPPRPPSAINVTSASGNTLAARRKWLDVVAPEETLLPPIELQGIVSDVQRTLQKLVSCSLTNEGRTKIIQDAVKIIQESVTDNAANGLKVLETIEAHLKKSEADSATWNSMANQQDSMATQQASMAELQTKNSTTLSSVATNVTNVETLMTNLPSTVKAEVQEVIRSEMQRFFASLATNSGASEREPEAIAAVANSATETRAAEKTVILTADGASAATETKAEEADILPANETVATTAVAKAKKAAVLPAAKVKAEHDSDEEPRTTIQMERAKRKEAEKNLDDYLKKQEYDNRIRNYLKSHKSREQIDAEMKNLPRMPAKQLESIANHHYRMQPKTKEKAEKKSGKGRRMRI